MNRRAIGAGIFVLLGLLIGATVGDYFAFSIIEAGHIDTTIQSPDDVYLKFRLFFGAVGAGFIGLVLLGIRLMRR